MAPPTEDWDAVGKIVGTLLFGAGFAFVTLYRTYAKRDETANGALTSKSVGAAFVDRTTAQNIATIAENTTKLREIAERDEAADLALAKKLEKEALIAEAVEALRRQEAVQKNLPPAVPKD